MKQDTSTNLRISSILVQVFSKLSAYQFFEFFAVAAKGDKLWSIRLYPEGVIVYRTPIMRHGILGIDQLREDVLGTFKFADKLLNKLNIEVREVCIVSRFMHADMGTLGVGSKFGQGAEVKLKRPAPEAFQIPLKARATDRAILSAANGKEFADKFTAELLEWFETGIDRFF